MREDDPNFEHVQNLESRVEESNWERLSKKGRRKERAKVKRGREEDVEVLAVSNPTGKMIEEVYRISRAMFPDDPVEKQEILKLVEEAYRSADDEYGEAEAITWADGFVFPQGLGERDAGDLASEGGNLASLVRKRHRAMPSRLSCATVLEHVPWSDPDFDALMSIADGIPIVTASGFEPNNTPPRLRSKYLRVAAAVNKLVYSQYQSGQVIILPTSVLLQMGGVHFSSTHWAMKKGKEEGRLIGDGSSDECGMPLNGKEVKQMVEELWGPIKHPTITTLVQKLYRVAEEVGWDNAILWKMDLKGAFNLMSIKPEDVRLLAFELTNGLSMLNHTGMFGHTEMPIGFDVISRVLRRMTKVVISVKSDCDIYVDDLMGASHRAAVVADLIATKKVCNKLLGDDSVSDKKTLFGRLMDMIGWLINLDTRTVSIARHNFLKTLHGFFRVDEDEPVRVGELQKLASWGVRYSTVCRAMRPFTHDLFLALKGNPSRNSFRRLDDNTKLCIKLWRCCLCMMELRGPARYSRSMESFLPKEPDWEVEFDGSLTGVGLRIFRGTGPTRVLWKVVGYTFPFDIPRDANIEFVSSYQNTCELIGPVLAMGVLAMHGMRAISIKASGDSKTALRWVTSERFRRGPSRNAAMCFTSLGMHFDMHYESSEHIPAEENKVCDSLSRDIAPVSLGYEIGVILRVVDYPALASLVAACNPMISDSGAASLEECWGLQRRLVEGLGCLG